MLLWTPVRSKPPVRGEARPRASDMVTGDHATSEMVSGDTPEIIAAGRRNCRTILPAAGKESSIVEERAQ